MKSPASMRASKRCCCAISSAERTAFGAPSSLPIVSIACVYMACLSKKSVQVLGQELLDPLPEVDPVLDLEPAVALAVVDDVFGLLPRGLHRGSHARAVIDRHAPILAAERQQDRDLDLARALDWRRRLQHRSVLDRIADQGRQGIATSLGAGVAAPD